MKRVWLCGFVCVVHLGCQGPVGPSGLAGVAGTDGAAGTDGVPGLNGTSHTFIEEDVRWEDTVLVAGTVVVRKEATLTLGAGTQLDFGPESHLVVEGRLVSEGTPEAMVSLASGGDWFSSVQLSGQATLQNVHMSQIELTVSGDGVDTIEQSVFSNSGVWIEDRVSSLVIRDSVFDFESFWRENLLTFQSVGGAMTVDSSFFTGGAIAISWDWAGTGSSLTVRNSHFEHHESGIRAGVASPSSAAVLVVENSTVSDVREVGIDVRSGEVFLTDVTVWDVGGNGIKGHSSATLNLVGVHVSEVGGTCVSSSGTAVNADTVVVEKCGSMGLSASNGTLTAENVRATENEGAGVSVRALTMKDSTVSDNGSSGVLVSGPDISTIVNSTVSGNGTYGVKGPSSGVNLVDVSGCNLTYNENRAANEVRLMSGNYVADNNGETGVDDGVGGVLDGVRNTDTPQINDADQIENPLLEPIAGAGVAE